MSWRLARGLEKLRSQVNIKHPNRNKSSDGTIGDAAHSARASDHNPRNGVVHALDLTHSPSTGFDAHAMVEKLRQSKDPRISYLISNRRIASSKENWAWRKYTGSNPHSSHVHISIKGSPHADDTKDWRI